MYRTALFAAPLLLLGATLGQRPITAVKAGQLWVDSRTKLENAVVLIEDGRIKAFGTDVEVPWNAEVLDASQRVVMPAWVVAHASGGMDQENENMPVTPFLTVLDSLDPTSPYFENARRFGIGTVHVLPGHRCAIGGRGVVVRPYGKTPEEMALVERAGMKVSLLPRSGSRSQHYALIVKALDDAIAYREDYERRKKEFEEDKANGATTAESFDEKIDPKQQPLLDLLDRKTTAYVYVPRATDVPAALRLVAKYRLSAVFVLGPDCYKALDLLKKAHESGIPLILDPDLEYLDKDPLTEEETLVCPAKVLYDAGLPFALSAAAVSRRGGGGAHPARQMPWWQVATCVRYGVPLPVAVAAFTEVPARVLGLSERVGKLAEGMDANLQVLSAPLLEPECQVEYLIVEGKLYYDRSKDPRYEALTGRPEAKGEGSRR